MAVQEMAVSVLPQVVQVRERGQVTIPAELRREMGITDGDVFSIIRLGDTLILVRKKLVVTELAEKMEKALAERGITLDDMLAELEIQRQRYNRETYGPTT